MISKLISAVRRITRNANKAAEHGNGGTIHLYAETTAKDILYGYLDPDKEKTDFLVEEFTEAIEVALRSTSLTEASDLSDRLADLDRIEAFLDEIGVPHSEAVFPRVKLMYETLTNSKEGNDGQTGS